jgi:uncharacterized protein YeaO (DUF488 family)
VSWWNVKTLRQTQRVRLKGAELEEKAMIQVKRVYESAVPTDGWRVLVDRLWPRGIRKEALCLDGWLKDVAPSDALRRWFKHDPAKWKEFQRRYRVELNDRPEAWRSLLEAAVSGNLTLLFSPHDTERNNAVVLKALLEERLKAGPKS